MYAQPQPMSGPRANKSIEATEIRLIGADGTNIGITSLDHGRQLAFEAGLDLVEVSPKARPPVCKIMDFGKYKYTEQKRRAVARKRQKTIDVKEVKLRPNTGKHDYDVKLRNVMRFLENGDHVKVTMRFRGREMAHNFLGRDVLDRVRSDVGEQGKILTMPKLEGQQMFIMIAPAK